MQSEKAEDAQKMRRRGTAGDGVRTKQQEHMEEEEMAAKRG